MRTSRLWLLLLAGCKPAVQAADAGAAPAPIDESPAAAAEPAPTHPTEAPSAAPTVKLLSWSRELEEPVRSFALGKRRAAALGKGGAVWMLDGGRWRPIPLPHELRAQPGEREEIRIFFGRDDRPRIMGSRWRGETASGVYLRYKGGWRREPGEIGRLANAPQAPLFGVLGHDDPEVVCKLGDACIVKRLSGWTTVPPGERLMRVELSSGRAYGLGGPPLMVMEKSGWEPLGEKAPFASASGVFAASERDLWVSETAANRLHRFDGERWSTEPSPIAAPAGMWGARGDGVWLAGEGAAHFDGSRWSRVEGPAGALTEVHGSLSSTEPQASAVGSVWLAGPAGVWHGR